MSDEITALMKVIGEIKGVNGIIFVSKDGTILASKGALEDDSTLVAFAGNSSNDASTMFTFGKANHMRVYGPDYKILIINRPDHYIGIITEKDAQDSLILSRIGG